LRSPRGEAVPLAEELPFSPLAVKGNEKKVVILVASPYKTAARGEEKMFLSKKLPIGRIFWISSTGGKEGKPGEKRGGLGSPVYVSQEGESLM